MTHGSCGTSPGWIFGSCVLSIPSLEDLRDACRRYATGHTDHAYYRYMAERSDLDFDREPRDAFIRVHGFLRGWRCRNLAIKDETFAVEQLVSWYEAWKSAIRLGLLDPHQLAEAYQALTELPIAWRSNDEHRRLVRMGATAASKCLFALNPTFFAAWNASGQACFEGKYPRYLSRVHAFIEEVLTPIAQAQGIAVEEMPMLLGRPKSTLVKLVDEYLTTALRAEADMLL